MSGAHDTQASIDLSATKAAAASKAVAVNLCFTVEGWTPADWGWRWLNLLVVLLAGMALNAAGAVGAGDAKFAAAAAPFVAPTDAPEVAFLLAAALLLSWAGHRLARASEAFTEVAQVGSTPAEQRAGEDRG